MSEVDAGWAAAIDEYTDLGAGLPSLLPQIARVAELLIERFGSGGRLFTFGNGGSAADAAHFTGELIGHYRGDRRPLPAVTIGTDAVSASCISNDYSFEDLFARQVRALVGEGDVVAAFSTSGQSSNVVRALAMARTVGATTVLFGGGDGGAAAEHADHRILVPSTSTPRIQEVHTLVLHLISDSIDRWAMATEATS